MPALGSLTWTSVWETDARTVFCPGGHSVVVGGGLRVRLPVIWPFLPEVNSPEPLTGPETSSFLGSAAKLPPSLRQA